MKAYIFDDDIRNLPKLLNSEANIRLFWEEGLIWEQLIGVFPSNGGALYVGDIIKSNYMDSNFEIKSFLSFFEFLEDYGSQFKIVGNVNHK